MIIWFIGLRLEDLGISLMAEVWIGRFMKWKRLTSFWKTRNFSMRGGCFIRGMDI